MQINLGAPPKTPGNAFIKDTDELRFEQDVLAASMNCPVLVDFWAPWCVPCKQMMPLLEKAVSDASGAVLMVKVNIDKNPGLAQALRIQSVPTVYAFFQGKPVDGFAGAKSEAEIRGFVGKLKLLASPSSAAETLAEDVKKIMAEGDAFFQQGNYDEAMGKYGAVLDLDMANMEALGGIGWCLLTQGDWASAQEMLSQLTPEQRTAPRFKGLQFMLSLQQKTAGLSDIPTLESAQLKNPADDLQRRFDLALQYFSHGLLEKGIEMLITVIRQNRDWEEKKARLLLLEIFEALGNTHPLTAPGRRKLSAVLFS